VVRKECKDGRRDKGHVATFENGEKGNPSLAARGLVAKRPAIFVGTQGGSRTGPGGAAEKGGKGFSGGRSGNKRGRDFM